MVVLTKYSLRRNICAEFVKHSPLSEEDAATFYPDLSMVSGRKKADQFILDKKNFKVLAIGLESLQNGEKKGRAYEYTERFLLTHNCMLVVDESHLIKGHKSIRTANSCTLGNLAKTKIIGTGTPISHGPLDLYSQFDFLDPNIIGVGDFYSFRNRYAQMGGYDNKEVIGYNNIDELMEILKPWVFQVTKEEMMPDLPPKIYLGSREVKMQPEQAKLYKKIKKDKIAGRLLNYSTFTLSVVFKLLFTKDKTPVFTHTTPPLFGIILAFICKIKKRKFNYVLLDIFPDGLVRLGKMKSNSLLVRSWRAIHRAALKRSNYIIVIGRDMKKWLLEFCPEVSERVHYIPIWQDEKLIIPIEYKFNPFVIEHKLMEKFIVQYSGNMGMWNDMRTLGEVVNRKLEDVVFMFIGGGMRKNELLDSINETDSKNVLFFPFLSNSDYSNAVTACHVALVSLHDGLEGMAVPSKIVGIMAAGIPVIAVVPEESEIAYIVNENKCGIVVKPGNINALINAIKGLKSNSSLRMQLGLNGRVAFEKKYTTSIIAKQYVLLLD